MEKFISFKNNQQNPNNNQFFPLEQNSNQNKFQTGQNKNIEINKDSHLFLHSKKFLNKMPSNLENSDINNNFQPSVDYNEPQPQIYQDLNLNKKNKENNNYQSSNLISPKINNNTNFSNQPNKNKLLEEYFKLKNDNNNYNHNYFTYNNYLYNPNNNKNNNYNNNKQNPEPHYQPLSQKQKIQKRQSNQNNPIKNTNKNIPPKKSTSSSRIYQPENNMNHSPSFTPIKNTKSAHGKNLVLKEKEKTKQSPYFGPKYNSKSNKDIKVNFDKSKNEQNSQRITHSEESQNHVKSIIKNKNKIFRQEKTKKISAIKNISKTPITPMRKNLTPSRKEIQTYIDFRKKNFMKNVDKNNYALATNLTSTNNNKSSINSTESYWRKKENEKKKKMEQIKTERILKEEKELQEKPKINDNSKKIMGKKYNYKTDVFDRLSDFSQIQNHNAQIEKIREQFKENHTPMINDNSKRMKRTVEDLYQWKNKNERKKIESAKYLNKINKKKFAINPQSEEILKEKKSDYINKKVEDRLLEQGRLQQYKNEIQREQYLNYISKSKKYTNNEYNNIHSRYLELPNYSNDNNIQSGNKSYEKLINKGSMISNYKTISLRNNNINNNININSDESYDINNYYNKNNTNYLNNIEQNPKNIYLDNNNGSNLINGNINNYIINNNYNNNIMLKPQKNQMEINDNLKKNHYQYFPNYNSNRNSDSNQYKKNGFKINNNNYEQKKYINIHTEKTINQIKINNNQRIQNNLSNQQNDIINIRKHLNEFYENKKNNHVQSNNLENYLSKINNKENDDSIKNGLLKGLLDNGNEENIENLNNQRNYNATNNNEKINQNLNNYNPNIIINKNQNITKINSYNNKNLSSYNNDKINEIKEDKQKYNFKPELLKDINKKPISGGLNFEHNKPKSFNYFQFQFDRNENKNNDDLNINIEDNIEKPYEYIQNNMNEGKKFQNNNKIQINNKNDKYSIEDSVKIKNFESNQNKINNNNYNNYDEIEKERRKQDLLQMINFSSNLKINNNNNYINNLNNQNNTNNYNDYENYNIVQSYEES